MRRVDEAMRRLRWFYSCNNVCIRVDLPDGTTMGRTIGLHPTWLSRCSVEDFCDFLAVQSDKMRQRLEDYYSNGRRGR